LEKYCLGVTLIFLCDSV